LLLYTARNFRAAREVEQQGAVRPNRIVVRCVSCVPFAQTRAVISVPTLKTLYPSSEVHSESMEKLPPPKEFARMAADFRVLHTTGHTETLCGPGDMPVQLQPYHGSCNTIRSDATTAGSLGLSKITNTSGASIAVKYLRSIFERTSSSTQDSLGDLNHLWVVLPVTWYHSRQHS